MQKVIPEGSTKHSERNKLVRKFSVVLHDFMVLFFYFIWSHQFTDDHSLLTLYPNMHVQLHFMLLPVIDYDNIKHTSDANQ